MDDHMFYWVKEYGECELIPRFQEECKTNQKITDCPSYNEMKDFCTVLSLIGKWAGFEPVKPYNFKPYECQKHNDRHDKGRDF